MTRQRFKQIVTIVSIVSFFGSTGYGAYGAINSLLKQPTEEAQAAVSAESQLQAQERGYEMVLQREPENQTALKGLVEARLQMKNAKGAVEPLKTLVRLNPDQKEYKVLLAKVKQRVDEGEHAKRK